MHIHECTNKICDRTSTNFQQTAVFAQTSKNKQWERNLIECLKTHE